MAAEAMATAEEEDKKFPLLQAKKNALYIITRANWERVSSDAGIIKGFIINPVGNDLHPFQVDRRDLNDDTNRSILWEYIAAGVGAKWKKVDG